MRSLTLLLFLLCVGSAHAAPTPRSIRTAALASRLHVTFGLDMPKALRHAQAAIAAELPGLAAEVLLATAHKESTFRPWLHGRLKTEAGVTRFCGVLQAMSHGSAKRCRTLLDRTTGYRVGAQEIYYWLTERCAGSLTCALRGHACGNSGLTTCGAAYADAVWARVAHMRAGTRYHSPASRRSQPTS